MANTRPTYYAFTSTGPDPFDRLVAVGDEGVPLPVVAKAAREIIERERGIYADTERCNLRVISRSKVLRIFRSEGAQERLLDLQYAAELVTA